jgi:hypothetical protein
VALVVVAGVGGAGLFFYAKYAMKDQMAELNSSIGAIGYARGGRVPDTAGMRREVERLAQEHGVTLEGLVIVREAGEGLTTAGRLANERLTGGSKTASGPFRMQIVRYRIRARATTSKWMFEDEHELDTERTFQAQTTFSPAAAPQRELPEREEEGHRGLLDG